MTDGSGVGASAEATVERPRPRGLHVTAHRPAIAMLVVGIVLTAVLAAASWSAYEANEERLLSERTSQAAAVLRTSIASLATPLISASELVAVTEGEPTTFVPLMAPLVGEDRRFVSASLWVPDEVDRGPLVVVGEEPTLAALPRDEISAFFGRQVEEPTLTVMDLLEADTPRLGYSYSTGAQVGIVVYVEQALPEERTSSQQADDAFADLDYALYIGREPRPERLILASTPDIPLGGRVAMEQLALGDADLLLVMSPMGDLGGALLRDLPWVILAAGAAISFGFAALNEGVLRRRDEAEGLVRELAQVADDNARLYSEQHSVAQALQQSLMLESLPDLPGLEVAARYEPGVEGIDVGGDWYDVIPRDGGRVLVVVGDVSGRGVQAATVMAQLRHSIRAFASQGDPPAAILAKLTDLISVARDGHFATVLVAEVDPADGTVVLANAGHPSPLVLDRGTAAFGVSEIGPPVGVQRPAAYPTVTTRLAEGATLLAFTDGLFERRGETVDVGLERLRAWVGRADPDLDSMLDGILHEFAGTPDDDAAILAVRWLRPTMPPT